MASPRWNEYSQAYNEAIRAWSSSLTEQELDLEYVLGDQWLASEKEYLGNEGREALVFNHIHRAIGLVSGYQRKHRLSLKASPIEGADEETANLFSALLLWNMQYRNGYQVMSDAFSGAMKTAINLVHLGIDYEQDPLNGDITYTRMPYNSFLLDPSFEGIELKNCRYILLRRYLDKGGIMMRLPKDHARIKDLPQAAGRDNKYYFFETLRDLEGNWLYRWDEMYVKTAKEHKYIADRQTGKLIPYQGTEKRLQLFSELLQNMGINFDDRFAVISHYKDTVELTIFVEEEEVYRGPDPSGLANFPFVPVIAYYDPEYKYMQWKLRSFVRIGRDPQREINKRRSKMLDIIDSQLASGWIAKENVVIDPDSLYYTGQGKVIEIRGDADINDIKPVPPPEIPRSLFQLSQLFDNDLPRALGINDELFGDPGKGQDKISGILSKLRMAAGLVVLQELFDNYRWSKKRVGQLQIEMMQKNYSPQKVARITGKQVTEEFYSRDFGKYDCIPEEGILTDTQRQMQHAQLIEYKTMGADSIPWSFILKTSTIENKEDLIEVLTQQEQSQQQEAQRQLELEKENRMLTNELVRAQVALQLASTQQKQASAQETLSDIPLNRAKAMAELQNMDSGKLLKVLEFIVKLEKEPTKDVYTGPNKLIKGGS